MSHYTSPFVMSELVVLNLIKQQYVATVIAVGENLHYHQRHRLFSLFLLQPAVQVTPF